MSRAIKAADRVREILVHTGQHFDPGMSEIFFEELGLAAPHVNLGIHGGGHGEMTGKMLAALERVIIEERPDLVLVPGDTTSTLAGALAAAKLHVPVAHLEAGLRSYNRRMPEEINRVLTDHISALLLCPTATAVANLRHEGVVRGVHDIGHVMYDATLFAAAAARRSRVLDRLGTAPHSYTVATVHRAESTEDADTLGEILALLRERARLHCGAADPSADTQADRGVQARSYRHHDLRSCRLSRHASAAAIGRCGVHRFRRVTKGSLFPPGPLRHLAQRDRVGGDRRGGLEPALEGARLCPAKANRCLLRRARRREGGSAHRRLPQRLPLTLPLHGSLPLPARGVRGRLLWEPDR